MKQLISGMITGILVVLCVQASPDLKSVLKQGLQGISIGAIPATASGGDAGSAAYEPKKHVVRKYANGTIVSEVEFWE